MRVKRYAMSVLVGLVALGVGGCLEINQAPIASFTRSPASGVAPLAVFFDAAASSDPDGTISSFEWLFGSEPGAETAIGVTATHTFAAPGTYSVTLKVIDDRGKTAETVRIVDIADSETPPPFGTELGNRAPDFSLANVRTGETQSLSDFRGYVVLLEFWRSTCSACRSSMLAVEQLRAKYADDGVIVVLVSQDVTAEEARALLDDQGYDEFIAVHDVAGAARELYGVELIPRLFIIDRQGIVRHVDHPIRIRDRHITPWL